MPQAYKKAIVPLRGGLDLVSPRFFVTPGTLQDDLNYETYSVAGYSVVEGIERYDGTYPCYTRDWIVATRSTGSGTFVAGEYLKANGNLFGVCVGWSGGVLSYLIQDRNNTPKIGQTITGNTSAATLVAAQGGIKRASVYYPDEAQYLEAQRVIYELARTNKRAIYNVATYAKNVIAHGLHWYKGRLFQIADAYQVSFTTGTVETFPNDKILLATSPIATVLSVNVTSGAWGEGTAAGTMVLRTDGFLIVNAVSTGSKTIRRPNGATGNTDIANAFVITDTQVPNAPFAQLYEGPYDDDDQTPAQIAANAARPQKAWTPVDMGWEAQFTTDSDTTGTAPSTIFRGNFQSDLYSAVTNVVARATNETLDASSTVTHPLGSFSDTNPASTALHTVLGDQSNTSFVRITTSTISTQTTPYAKLGGFDLSSIPDAAIITGLEVSVIADTTTNVALAANFKIVGTTVTGNTTKTVNLAANTSTTTTVLGGATDLWGVGLSAPNLLVAVRDSSFGLSFNMSHTNSAALSGISRIREVSLKVYYKLPVAYYYAHDPISGQDLQIEIPYYRLLKGQFNPGVSQDLWGSGNMSIYTITPLDTDGTAPNSTTWTIGTGWELRNARHGTGDLIAKFSAQMQPATLPARATMEAVQKRFEIINANYYANADWAAFYGVSGAGPSFQYDGYYFYNVYTAITPTDDTPSHIAYHRNYAVLGYENGQCVVSVPGEPTNFDPIAGSTLYPFGNRITGLLSLNGTALGVFCETAIYGLLGDVLSATTANNAVSQIIAANSGAIEYTVVDCGTPLFADFRGISTIDATNKYGDFENGRVSYQITPLLTERVNDRFSYQATNQNVMFAQPVRNKNQYRLYFANGDILTCGLPIGDRGYEFTRQRYDNSTTLDSMVPVAMCTGTTRSGRDLIFGTFKLVPFDDTNIATPDQTEREVYVYAMDKGTRFDLAPIKHFARLNYMPLGEPNQNDVVRKLRFELLTNHYFNGYVSLTADYAPPSNVRRAVEIDPTDKSVRIDKDSDFVIVSTEGIGTTIAIEVGGEHIYPGHVLQALLTYSIGGREQLGDSPTQKLT